MRLLLTCAALALTVSGLVWADVEAKGDEAKCQSKCATSEKIAKVLASWKEVGEAAKSQCPDEAAKVAKEISAAAKECPVGSRLGETLAFVKSTLESAIAFDEASAKSCPLAAKTTEAAAPAACGEASKLKETRTQLLASLKALADNAACASASPCAEKAACSEKKDAIAAKAGLCASKATAIVAQIRAEECCKGAAAIVLKGIDGLKCEEKASAIVASVREEKCDEGAAQILIKASQELCAQKTTAASVAEGCAKGGVCCQDLMARATQLKASWEKVPAEFKGMCPQKKQELMASVGALSKKSRVLALMPETVSALADGFQALGMVNGKMSAWAKANPEALKDVPCDARKAFEAQNALLETTGAILNSVKASFGNATGECQGEKTETASAK